jgi:L,D-transpeptidase catalytic domain
VLKSQLQTPVRFVRSAFLVAVVIALTGAPTHARERKRASASPAVAAAGTSSLGAAGWDRAQLGSLDPRVFGLALNAASCAVQAGKASAPTTLTVIDFSKPSTEKRLWVVDLRTHALLFEELVAHGQGSGNNMATRFSNDAETHSSSIGLYAAKDAYLGKNGYSLRLDGLDTGFNDHAMERAIVIHGAAYVSEEIARAQGRLGRSWGCPALRPEVAHDLIDRVKDSGLIFAYYPDPRWLASSPFLHNCYGDSGSAPVVATG